METRKLQHTLAAERCSAVKCLEFAIFAGGDLAYWDKPVFQLFLQLAQGSSELKEEKRYRKAQASIMM